jgi:hypothetical protein
MIYFVFDFMYAAHSALLRGGCWLSPRKCSAVVSELRAFETGDRALCLTSSPDAPRRGRRSILE